VSLSEAEAEACLQGLTLVAEWIRQPTIVEPDYTEDRSQWAVLVDEIKGYVIYYRHVALAMLRQMGIW
jgi:hypothetical protein